MRIIRLLLPVACLASPLAAQTDPLRLEISADVSYWRLNDGTATLDPTTRPAGSVRAAVLLATRRPSSLGFSAAYAEANRSAPGMLAFSAEFAQRLFPDSPERVNLFIAAGAGMQRYYKWVGPVVNSPCPETGCIYERRSHDEEWRPTISASLGADVGVVRGVLVQPTLGIIKPLPRSELTGTPGAMFRLGIGIAWRP